MTLINLMEAKLAKNFEKLEMFKNFQREVNRLFEESRIEIDKIWESRRAHLKSLAAQKGAEKMASKPKSQNPPHINDDGILHNGTNDKPEVVAKKPRKRRTKKSNNFISASEDCFGSKHSSAISSSKEPTIPVETRNNLIQSDIEQKSLNPIAQIKDLDETKYPKVDDRIFNLNLDEMTEKISIHIDNDENSLIPELQPLKKIHRSPVQEGTKFRTQNVPNTPIKMIKSQAIETDPLLKTPRPLPTIFPSTEITQTPMTTRKSIRNAALNAAIAINTISKKLESTPRVSKRGGKIIVAAPVQLKVGNNLIKHVPSSITTEKAENNLELKTDMQDRDASSKIELSNYTAQIPLSTKIVKIENNRDLVAPGTVTRSRAAKIAQPLDEPKFPSQTTVSSSEPSVPATPISKRTAPQASNETLRVVKDGEFQAVDFVFQAPQTILRTSKRARKLLDPTLISSSKAKQQTNVLEDVPIFPLTQSSVSYFDGLKNPASDIAKVLPSQLYVNEIPLVTRNIPVRSADTIIKTPRGKGVVPGMTFSAPIIDFPVLSQKPTFPESKGGIILPTPKVESWTSQFLKENKGTTRCLNPVANIPSVPKFPLNVANISSVVNRFSIPNPPQTLEANEPPQSTRPTSTKSDLESPLTRAKRIEFENYNRVENLERVDSIGAERLKKSLNELKSLIKEAKTETNLLNTLTVKDEQKDHVLKESDGLETKVEIPEMNIDAVHNTFLRGEGERTLEAKGPSRVFEVKYGNPASELKDVHRDLEVKDKSPILETKVSKLPVKPKHSVLPSPRISSKLVEEFSGIDSELPPVDLSMVDDDKVVQSIRSVVVNKKEISPQSSEEIESSSADKAKITLLSEKAPNEQELLRKQRLKDRNDRAVERKIGKI